MYQHCFYEDDIHVGYAGKGYKIRCEMYYAHISCFTNKIKSKKGIFESCELLNYHKADNQRKKCRKIAEKCIFHNKP